MDVKLMMMMMHRIHMDRQRMTVANRVTLSLVNGRVNLGHSST